MAANGIFQILFFFILILILMRPLGAYMTRVFRGEKTLFSPLLLPIERFFYWLSGVDPRTEQRWMSYTIAMLVFNLVCFLGLYALLRFQAYLPFNPRAMDNMAPDLAFNTAVSFITNTNWQNYAGETSLSYFSQMVGLTTHNFVSSATGIALAIAFIRAFARASSQTLGNFWVDLTRCVLYILLPIAFLAALFLVSEGVPQTLSDYVSATTLEGAKQTIALGPVASQVAIKMLGTNGGGFFNANAAHPFENPTALSNLFQMILMIVLAASLTNVFGRMVGNEWQGFSLFGCMAILSIASVFALYAAEANGNPNFDPRIDQTASDFQAGGNMEGKEVRFGLANSSLFAALTTDASCGAVNTMHESLTPLGGLMTLLNMQLGEIVWGGAGSGLYGILLFAIIAMFIAGLMVGRTPEYIGKKLEVREVKMTMLALLVLPFATLGLTALAIVIPQGTSAIANAGPHGFSEVLYAYSSATANNGSAFAGLNANTLFYNLTLGFAMLIGRFGVIVPMMAVAGSLAAKKIVPPSSGTFPTDNGLFVALLTAIIVIVGGLTYFPALALGPVAEHMMMQAGTLF